MEYVKVSKPIARKMYNSGLTVNLLPCKVSTCSVWIRPFAINKAESENLENQFDRTVNAFQYYNCNAETGYYSSFYVDEDNYTKYEEEL